MRECKVLRYSYGMTKGRVISSFDSGIVGRALFDIPELEAEINKYLKNNWVVSGFTSDDNSIIILLTHE